MGRQSGISSTAPYFYRMSENKSGWRWVPSLYVFQGVPSCLVMTTSSLMYSDMGISLSSIAFWTSAVSLPWSLKPLWAPLVERYGTKREWVRTTQLVLVVAFLLLGLSMVTGGFFGLSLALMFAIAMASSLHDIACDGYYMMALDERGQSFFVGIRSTFYRVAMVLTTGMVPLLAGKWGGGAGSGEGWMMAIGCAGVLLAVMAILCRVGMPRVTEVRGRQDDGLKIFVRALRSFFTHKGAVAAVTFFFVYRLGEAVLSKAVLPFLNTDRAAGGLGISVESCGVVYGTFGVLALVAGGVLGGIMASRWGLRRVLWPMIVMMNVPNLGYVALAYFMPDGGSWWVTAAVMTEQFGYGLGFTAYMLVMLKYVGEAEYKAAEYAIGTSIMSLGLILPGMLAGVLMGEMGWSFVTLFIVACVATLPGVIAATFLNLNDKAA